MASKRLRAANAEQGEDLKVDLSPMIDMVFLLLIFFIVNASMVIVAQDPNVDIPVARAAHSLEQTQKNGRIVVNIYEDGTFATELGRDSQPFADDDDQAIFDYLEKRKDAEKLKGYTPVLHLRGDKASVFKHARKVIRIAGNAGINEVKFATYGTVR